MLLAETYVGHREDDAVAERLADAESHRVRLSDDERRRSRVRTETVAGADLGVVVGRRLRDGDVLETEDGEPIVVELAAREAMVVPIADADVSPTEALALGHAAGNRHWDLAIEDGEALFPVPEDRERMRNAIEDVLPEDATVRFEAVPPTTFGDDGSGGAHGHEGHTHDEHGRDHREEHSHDGHSQDDHSHDGHSHHEHSRDEHSHDHREDPARDGDAPSRGGAE